MTVMMVMTMIIKMTMVHDKDCRFVLMLRHNAIGQLMTMMTMKIINHSQEGNKVI